MLALLGWSLSRGEVTAVDLAWNPTAANGLFRGAWRLELELIPLLAYIACVTGTRLYLQKSEPMTGLTTGAFAGAVLVCVAQDVTTFLFGWGAMIMCISWSLAGSTGHALSPLFLRWQMAGWMGLLLCFSMLAGSLSLVRSAPHSAPSQTGFLLAEELLRLGELTAQHPAAVELWLQLRGWVLLVGVGASLMLSGIFPFHGWLREVSESADAADQLWIHGVLTKLPCLFLLRILTPVFEGSQQLVLFALAVPATLGLLIVAAELTTQPLTLKRWRSRPLIWGNQFAFLIVALGVLDPTTALWTAIPLLGIASILWILAEDSHHAVSWKQSLRWLAALTFCGIPVAAGSGSVFVITLLWPQTESPFDTLAWLGVIAALLVFSRTLLPLLLHPVNAEPAEVRADIQAVQRPHPLLFIAWGVLWLLVVGIVFWRTGIAGVRDRTPPVVSQSNGLPPFTGPDATREW